jgi:peptidyl-prolyl cis-trans isomerase D
MFDFVQKYKRAMQVVLGLIAITFATWGIESYTRFRGDADAVATVNGLPIFKRELEETMRRQQDQLRQALGRGYDSAAFDTPQARRSLLESLISQRLVLSEGVRSNLTVTREALDEAILGIEAFRKDGRYDPETAKMVLRSQGLSEQGFAAQLRSELSTAQLARAVGAAIPSRTTAGRLAALALQTREVASTHVPAQQFAAQVKLDEAKLKAYFESHQAEFRTPERVRAQYVVLSADELAKQEQVPEAELKAAYDTRASQYRVEEQRRASHILVKTREEAERLLAEVRPAPAKFGELARKHSQDSGSAAKGGDLGFLGRGMTVKPFEDALFAMKAGEIAGPVQSEFGFHVVRLTGIQGAKARPFEEVRQELAGELAKQKGARKFAEAAETFGNMAYEQPDSLNPVAERFKLALRTSGWVTRSASQELGALDHPKLLAALFSADAIRDKRNTDAFEVAPSTLVAARVLEHQPESQRKFEEVRADIEKLLRGREAAALAHKEGAAKLAQARAGGDAGIKWGPVRAVSRRDSQGLVGEALRRVLGADVSKLPAYVGVELPDGYALYRISKVIEAGPQTEEQKGEAIAAVGQLLGAAQYNAFVASLREQAEVEINTKNLEAK